MKTRAEFMAFVKERQAGVAALEERARALATLPAVRFSTSLGLHRMLASVDTNPDGLGWRLTHFDDAGPMGHQEHPSLMSAIVAALREGGEPILDRSQDQ